MGRNLEQIPPVSMIETSQKSALYRKYEAIYYAYQDDDSFFTLTQSNTELTTVMGGRPWSWHVIGITKAALLRYKELDFRHAAKSGITRDKQCSCLPRKRPGPKRLVRGGWCLGFRSRRVVRPECSASARAIFCQCAWPKGVCTITVRAKIPSSLLLNYIGMF